MPDTRMVVIRNPKTGREGAILPADFTRKNVHPDGAGSYAEQGYVIERYEDGSEYQGPKSQLEIDKAAEAKQTARAAKADGTPAPRDRD